MRMIRGQSSLHADSIDSARDAAERRPIARRRRGVRSRPALEKLEDRVLLAIFTVNSVADPGSGTCDVAECTLREAIDAANANPNGAGADEIRFGIAGAGPHTIVPAAELPPITEAVIIDGYSQSGASPNTLANGDNAVLKIELNGSSLDSGHGIEITAGGSTVKGLVINRFSEDGIRVTGSGNQIEGNFIGTNVTGTMVLANGGSGVAVFRTTNNTIGGTTATARNVISGNDNGGIQIFANFGQESETTANLVVGNFIGTDRTGTQSVGNSKGVAIFNASSNTVGGTTAAERNIISGNRQEAIEVSNPSPDNVIQGNFMGVDVSGVVALGNGGSMDIANAPRTQILNNIIAGNRGGISLHNPGTESTIFRGNFIGTDATGTLDLGNDGDAINMCCSSHFTQIGGVNPGDGNVIAFNSGRGVFIENSSGVSILGNRMFANGGMGIDHRPDGVGGGPAVPVITSVTEASGTTTIRGTLDSSTSSLFRLEFFANAEPDPSVSGEGEIFLGAVSQSTDGSGRLDFMADFPAASVPAGSFLTATATGPNGETSEFSRAFLPGADQLPAIQVVTNTNDTGPGSLRRALFNVAFHPNGAVPDEIRFSIPTNDPGCNSVTGVCTIRPNVVLPTITDATVIDGYSQDNSQANANTTDLGLGLTTSLKIVINGANAGTPGLHITAGNSTVRGLVINGFSEDGIRIEQGGGNTIVGNFIGTDVTGSASVPNGDNGIEIFRSANNTIGGSTAAAANLISGNVSTAVNIGTSFGATDTVNNLIAGNLIGTNAAGNAAIGNRNGVIAFNSSGNTIGGPAASARNIISGNENAAVVISNPSPNHRVENNFIGTDVTGAVALGNGGGGLEISNSSNTVILNNVISANGGDAINMHNPGTGGGVIQGNKIGTDVSGVQNLGNAGSGIELCCGADNTRIGGVNPGEGNVIAFNGRDGVVIVPSSVNGYTILGNSIHTNGELGFDHFNNGVGNGPAIPFLTSVTLGSIRIQGTLTASADTTYRIEFFDNRELDPTDFGEGETLLGSSDVLTDATGVGIIDATFPSTLPAGHFITATATRVTGPGTFADTSEFSAPPPTILGQKYLDYNANGVKDPGEPGLNGWRIELVNPSNGSVLATADTAGIDLDGDGTIEPNERGLYAFSSLTLGDYIVREVLQSGFHQSGPAGLGSTHAVTLTAADPVIRDRDFGNFELNSIRGTKTRDIGGDGFTIDDTPLDGTVINLFRDDGDGMRDAGDTPVASQPSGQLNPGSGVYAFTGLTPARYFVEEQVPAGFVRTGGPAFYNIVLAADGFNIQNDFANFEPGEIRGVKFNDEDGDGTKDGGEPLLQNWTIELRDLASGQLQSTTTNAAGEYAFTGLPPGTYVVSEVNQLGWDQTAPPRVSLGLFGADGAGNNASTLFRIDPTTGAATSIGPIGFGRVGGFDFHPTTDVLYGAGVRTSDGTLVLITIDTATGAGTEVGPLGITDKVQGVSFRSDGTLFVFYDRRRLGTVDLTTGAVTELGSDSSGDGNGIAFSSNDTLFLAQGNDLETLNQTNGDQTFVVDLNRSRFPALDFHPTTGELFGALNEGTDRLAEIDVATGNVTVIGQTASGLESLAWAPGVRVHLIDLGIGQKVLNRDFGNRIADTDDDGIIDLIDTQPLVSSNDFSDGTTSGTIMRNGWIMTVFDLPSPQGVRVSITGAGSNRATANVCPSSGAEEVRLNAATETADITCGPPSPSNGSATVTAVVTANQIVVRKPPGGAVAARLDQGETATIGSPVTAGPGSTIEVDLDDDDDDDNEPPGSFELEPNESADVEVTGEDEIEITMLVGDTTVVIAGMTEELSEGESQSFSVGTIAVGIDIKPNDRKNVINVRWREPIPVAILSTADFDAVLEVARASLTFGRTGDEPSLLSCRRRAQDVNGDGRPDLTCDFDRRIAGFQPVDTVGILRGETIIGTPIEGSDFVRIKPRPRGRSAIAAIVAAAAEETLPTNSLRYGEASLPACINQPIPNRRASHACKSVNSVAVDAAIASLNAIDRHRSTDRLALRDLISVSVLDLLADDLR
jgi:CSLREA domain-containing protein